MCFQKFLSIIRRFPLHFMRSGIVESSRITSASIAITEVLNVSPPFGCPEVIVIDKRLYFEKYKSCAANTKETDLSWEIIYDLTLKMNWRWFADYVLKKKCLALLIILQLSSVWFWSHSVKIGIDSEWD